MKKEFKVTLTNALDLMIAYESVDGTLRCDDDLGTVENFERQMAVILEESERQETDDPVLLLEIEE